MAIVNRSFRSVEFASHARRLHAAMSRLFNLCAISLAAVLAGCAQDPAPRDVVVATPPAKTVHASQVAAAEQPPEHRYMHARIRRLGPALLRPQPAPNCEYKRSDVKTVDPEEFTRLKTEFELRCYRDAEKAARTRLGMLQSSVRHMQD